MKKIQTYALRTNPHGHGTPCRLYSYFSVGLLITRGNSGYNGKPVV